MKPRILVIDNGSTYLDRLVAVLEGLSARVEVRKPPDDDYGGYEGIVVSGRRVRPSSSGERRRVIGYYRRLYLDAKMPVFSICFGCEVFAFTYGARVRRMEEGEFGVVEIRFHDPYPLADGVDRMMVYQSHTMMIEELPACIKSYASSRLCRHQALKHTEKPQFGVQFHPEMMEDDVLLKSFVRLCEGAR